MIFRGEDKSVVECGDTSLRMYYKDHLKGGKRFKDIQRFDFGLTEHMWVYGLHTTYIEALDLKYVYEATKPLSGRVEAVYRLKSDKERCKMLKENLDQLIALTFYGHECSYALISQTQKHLHQLEASIKDREALINSEVHDLVATN